MACITQSDFLRVKKRYTTHRKDNAVEQDSRCVEWLRKAAEAEMRGLEVVRRHGEAQQRDEAVRRDRRDTARRNQGCECNLAWKDGAEERGTEDEHDCHGVARLAVVRDLANPAGEREHTVTRHGEDQAGGGDYGDTRVLKMSSGEISLVFWMTEQCASPL